MSDEILQRRIDLLKETMMRRALERGDLADPSVLIISQQLDHYILTAQRRKLRRDYASTAQCLTVASKTG